MAKQLITTANLDTYIRKDLGKLFVTPDRLVTAGVKDELKRRGVQLVYGPEPAPVQPVCCSAPQADGADKLKRAAAIVVAILREQYGMTDESQIQAVAVKILKAVKDSI